MPNIVAICPYCRAGGVRAPASAVGASATCPKCGSSFTVMPSEEMPGWAKGGNGGSPTAPPAAPSADTRPAAAMPDETEPSPVLPGDDKPRRKSRPAPVVTTAAEEPTEAEPADPGLVLALLALILVGVAVVASQFPFGRVIALVIAGVGFLAGLGSLGAEGRAKLFGGLAMGLHAVIVLVVLFLPSWLNLDPWRGPADDTLKGPFAVDHGTGTPTPISPNDWLDSGKSSWEFQDVRVTVRSAAVAPIELIGPKGTKRMTKESYLQLSVRVANIGVERQIPLSGWATGQADALTVTDATGKALKPATFEEGWAPELGIPLDRVMPSHSSELRFVFAAPPAKTDSLRLTLPGSAFGMPNEEIKFRIGGLAGRPVGP